MLTTMNTSYNFTNLLPNVTYNVTVAADNGIPAVIMVTTVTVETGRPMGEKLQLFTLLSFDALYKSWIYSTMY